MRRISEEEIKKAFANRKPEERLSFAECEIWDMDLSGEDFSNADFTLSSFQNTVLNNVSFENSSVENALFDGCPLRNVNFKNAIMRTASFRYCDMRECNIEDANLFGAVLEHANLEGIVSNEGTQWFRLRCPETGAFLAYKKCVNDRMVQLLVPADAKRTSATLPSCRCNKAKVLTIKSFDYKENFEEAWSLVDENFVYKKGEWVEVKDFNEDRWMDSTTGIHFWMTRKEAQDY
ncbi:MAG: pentapeptide repeat-containing protein [Lachnospiraceae bacterium]